MTAYAIFGLLNPLRDTIVPSIKKCKTAGIKTIMVTSDNKITSKNIAINAKIITQEEIDANPYSVMEGLEFSEEVGGFKKVIGPDGKEIEVVSNMTKFKEIKH